MINHTTAAQATNKEIRAGFELCYAADADDPVNVADLGHFTNGWRACLISQLRTPVDARTLVYSTLQTKGHDVWHRVNGPVADEREAIQETAWPKPKMSPPGEWNARLVRAITQLDPKALDTWRAEDWSELLERRPAILALLRPLVMASALVAGEANSTSWQDALRISELPEVDEVLCNFANDSTGDNAVGLVQAILNAAPQASEAAHKEAAAIARSFGAPDMADALDPAKGTGQDGEVVRNALEALIREAQAVADDYHRPRYARLDEAILSARAALSAQPGAQKEQSDA